MNNETSNGNDAGVELAKKLAEADEGIGRKPNAPAKLDIISVAAISVVWIAAVFLLPKWTGIPNLLPVIHGGFAILIISRIWPQHLIPGVALSWSFFQLYLACPLFNPLDSTFTRSIHLGFAILLVFLNYPFLKKEHRGLKFLSEKNELPIFDCIVAVTASFLALYLTVDYAGISMRSGAPIERDIVIGVMLLIFLLEATRRVIGFALPLIATLFCIYIFSASHMPDFIAGKSASLNKFISQMTMSTEGIYGVPLDVSARIVFLFVLFGSMLEKAGAGHYFIQLALSLLGGFKGGPAKAAVISSGLMGMVSGSSIANVVTCGTFTIPLMKKIGYPATKAAAIEVAAGIDGQITPPVMGAAAFIIAEYVNVPYLDVCKAAAIPAFTSYATLFFIVHVEACKLGLRGIPRDELPPFVETLVGGFHYLLPLVFLLYQLMVLRRSPEAAAFYAIGAIAVIILFQHPVKAFIKKEELGPAFKKGIIELFSGITGGGRNMISVALATASAGVIVGIIAMGLGNLITAIIETLSMNSVHLMLVITAIASVILGMGIPTTATYIVVASLTAPAILTIANQHENFTVPLMAAHLFCFYFGVLADDTPPVGLATYAASAIAKSPIIPTGIQGFKYHIRTAILPFMFIFNSDLILHNINSWVQAILIYVMTCVGSFAFASATQGWFVARNKIYEIPIFLCVTFIMMRPDAVAPWLGIPHSGRYWVYPIGLAIYGILYLMQRPRISESRRIAEMKK
jgi:TRAP transporter 4TM/12TM fusion protein